MAAEHTARIGARIREARESKGWSQRQLAEAIPGNAGSDQVSKWERGIHRPGDDTLEQIARVTERDVAWFHTLPAEKQNGTPRLLDGLAPVPPDVLGRLSEVEKTLTQILKNQEQLLALIGQGAKGDDYFAMVQRTLDTMVSRLGREVGRPRPRSSEGPGQSPPRAA